MKENNGTEHVLTDDFLDRELCKLIQLDAGRHAKTKFDAIRLGMALAGRIRVKDIEVLTKNPPNIYQAIFYDKKDVPPTRPY